jgi:hypothetical protein
MSKSSDSAVVVSENAAEEAEAEALGGARAAASRVLYTSSTCFMGKSSGKLCSNHGRSARKASSTSQQARLDLMLDSAEMWSSAHCVRGAWVGEWVGEKWRGKG